jgi:hypothetical protein
MWIYLPHYKDTERASEPEDATREHTPARRLASVLASSSAALDTS